jgi:hypothetical protein
MTEKIQKEGGLASSQAPYPLASSQAQKLGHSAAPPSQIKALALI